MNNTINHKIKLGALSLIVSVLLIGCDSSSPSTTQDLQSTADLSTGTFIDSAVSGVEYETTSGHKGKTNAKGEFKYKKGDKVRLHLGNLDLGEVTPKDDGLVTPALLAEGNSTRTKLLLRTLQSLDTDGNTSNGIQIDDALLATLKEIEKTSIKEHTESTLLELDATFTKHLDDNGDKHIDVKEEEAKYHYQDSIKIWNQEHVNEDKEDDKKHGNTDGEHGQGQSNQNSTNLPTEIQTAIDDTASKISQELANTLAYMENEERLAYDVYTKLYDTYGIKQFKNISEKSEIKHIEAVKALVKKYTKSGDIKFTNIDLKELGYKDTAVKTMVAGKYDIQKIQDLYNTLVEEASTSEISALKVGCEIEVVDVDDLNKYIKIAQNENAEDIEKVFNYLRDGSYNHYWAFDKGLKKNGKDKGCCTWENLCKTPEEYPQKEKGSESSESNEDGKKQRGKK